MSTITLTNFVVPTQFRTAKDQYINKTGTGDWIKVTGDIVLQITGDTYVEAIVERSSEDPATTANPAPIAIYKGDTDEGVEPMTFNEPFVAWWRVRVTQCQGGTAIVCLTGGAA